MIPRSITPNRTRAFSKASRERIPKGFRLKAQGCEERATLGDRRNEIINPNGVAAAVVNGGRNPVGVVTTFWSSTQGSSLCSQPWALRRNPFGIESQPLVRLHP